MLGMLAVTLEVGLADHPLAPSLHGHHHRRCPAGALEMSHAASIGSANPSTQRHSESISSLTRSCIALFALHSLQCNCTVLSNANRPAAALPPSRPPKQNSARGDSCGDDAMHNSVRRELKASKAARIMLIGCRRGKWRVGADGAASDQQGHKPSLNTDS